jgi:D-sedoheptulose 7-phosphate isomerase
MSDYSQFLIKNIQSSIFAKNLLKDDLSNLSIFNQAVSAVIQSYQSGGRLYIAGNGGSAADAQHLAAEFVSKLARDRAPLPAEALTTDSSILTAIGNDYSFDKVFSRQLAGKLQKHDIFLGITTSGNSKNIIEALKQCKALSIPSIIFTGTNGGHVKSISDYCIVAPGDRTSTIQEVHILLAHTLCEVVEHEIFFSKST